MKIWILPLLLIALSISPARAEDAYIQNFSVAASPLQVTNAFTQDWQLRQWTGAHSVALVGSGNSLRYQLRFENDRSEEVEIHNLVRGESFVLHYASAGQPIHARFRVLPTDSGSIIELSHDAESIHPGPLRDAIAHYWETRLPKLLAYLREAPGSFYVRGEGDGTYPAILVLHDRFGLNANVRAFCNRLADAGYAALAVDMFRGEATSDLKQAAGFLNAVDHTAAVASAMQALDALRSKAETRDMKCAVIGFGFGADRGLDLLSRVSRVNAAVLWHGLELPEPNLLSRISAPLLAIFADPNPASPRPQIAAYHQALVQAGVRVENIVLVGGSEFSDMAYGEAYADRAIAEGWQRTLDFFRKQLQN